jgi:hypothetical protein
MSIEPVLRWAASQVGAGARAVAVEGLRAGAGPWRLRIDRGGTVLEAVLRVGDTSSRQLLATEAAALALAEPTSWRPHGCWPSIWMASSPGDPPC